MASGSELTNGMSHCALPFPPLFLLPGVALRLPDHAIGVEKAELLSAQESHWHDVLFPSLRSQIIRGGAY